MNFTAMVIAADGRMLWPLAKIALANLKTRSGIRNFTEA
jgi:hypothetical protein